MILLHGLRVQGKRGQDQSLTLDRGQGHIHVIIGGGDHIPGKGLKKQA